MNITLTSFLNTLLFSTLAILLLSFAISKINLFIQKGTLFLLVIMCFIMLRLFLPFEIFSQQNIFITGIYHKIYLAVTKTKIPFAGTNWTPLSILVTLSVLGSVLLFLRFILHCCRFKRQLKKYPLADSDTLSAIVQKINSEIGRTKQFPIVYGQARTVPYITGLFRPVIVLPKDVFSDNDLYYILFHEITHYYHKDLWIRFVCEFLQILYWWNPAVYTLRKKMIEFQEICADKELLDRFQPIQQVEYWQCLIKAAKSRFLPASDRHATFGSQNTITKRIQLLSNIHAAPIEKRQHFVSVFSALLLILLALVLPNLVIIEPTGSIPEEILQYAVPLDKDNAYLIRNEQGKYDIYVYNEYFSTVSGIIDDSLPIYNYTGEQIK